MTLDRPLREQWRNALVYVWHYAAMDRADLSDSRLEQIRDLVDLAAAELQQEVVARHRSQGTKAEMRCPVCEAKR